MDWNEELFNNAPLILKNSRPQIVLFTNTSIMYFLEELLKAIPSGDFICLSYFAFPDNLSQMVVYDNFKAYPSSTRIMLENFLDQACLYLSINETGNIYDIFEIAQDHNVPIFSVLKKIVNYEEKKDITYFLTTEDSRNLIMLLKIS